jgi:endonuclease/exonuclease/phosphatase (EEP) superfamily protein YafD
MLIHIVAAAGLGYFLYEHYKKKVIEKVPPMKLDIKLPPVLGGQTVTVSKRPDSVINTLAQAANIAANAEQIKKNISTIQHTVADVQRIAPQVQAKQPQIQKIVEAATHIQNPAQAAQVAQQAVSTISDIANMFGEPRTARYSGKRYQVKT